MNCKDCFHHEICRIIGDLSNLHVEFYSNGNGGTDMHCLYFKDKSKIVELPCKVGDRVYRICNDRGRLYVKGMLVGDLRFDENTELIIVAKYQQKYRFNKIADIFYTKEEAEARLKELQNG